jgi:hypothetical protein
MRGNGIWWLVLGAILLLGLETVCIGAQPSKRGRLGGSVGQEEVRRAAEVLARHEAQLLKVPGVVGVGIGATEQEGRTAIHFITD